VRRGTLLWRSPIPSCYQENDRGQESGLIDNFTVQKHEKNKHNNCFEVLTGELERLGGGALLQETRKVIEKKDTTEK
jgi:hypothetical protein